MESSAPLKDKPKITIALHTGKLEWYPLVENFLKSFLVCVQYPNIELMLIESGENKAIREWFERLNFDENFINFDGTISTIRKNEGTNIEKTLLFCNFKEENFTHHMCYNAAIKKATEKATGEYFVVLAEDNQFVVKGDILDDYLKILDYLGTERSNIQFCGMQEYKYYKTNNVCKPISQIGNIKFFEMIKMKWSFFGLTKRSNFNKIGEILIPLPDAPTSVSDEFIEKYPMSRNYRHCTEISYTYRARVLGYTKVFPCIPHAVWMHNDHNDACIKLISEYTKKNPDYILYRIFDKKDLQFLDYESPLTVDDFFNYVNDA